MNIAFQPKDLLKARTLLKALIISIFLLGNFLNLQSGWADNGDFNRIMTWFTSGPEQIQSWPTEGTVEWNRRFLYYWIPDWKLDYPGKTPMFVSAVLLWAPGVMLNRYFYSAYTLYLPIMSVAPRLLLFLFLLMVFKWIDHRSKFPTLHYLALALPLALLFSTSDVVAFFNSFYQETGSIVFVSFLLALVVYGHFKLRDWKFDLAYFVMIMLVSLSKTASFYWPVLTIPFVISFNQVKKRPFVYIPVGLIFIILPLVASLELTEHVTVLPYRAYTMLFGGTLQVSANPQAQLNRMGLSDASDCLGVDAYTTAGIACLTKLNGRIYPYSFLQTIFSEPAIIIRQVDILTHTIQNYSLQLGKYAYNDQIKRQDVRLNFWSTLKQRIFPRGWALLATFLAFGFILIISWRKDGLIGDLSFVGLLCALAFWVDSFVEIWGDGQRDLLKHLVMPNLLFDFLMIAIINIALGMLLHQVSTRISVGNHPANKEIIQRGMINDPS